jgi:hypothetical protein
MNTTVANINFTINLNDKRTILYFIIYYTIDIILQEPLITILFVKA